MLLENRVSRGLPVPFFLLFFSGIKDYSNWPTIPQIYFKGEFIGGCDILLQMHQSGELTEELQKIGITSALLSDAPEKEKRKGLENDCKFIFVVS